MSAIEQLVRPFQTPQPFGTRRVLTTATKLPTETSHTIWGSVGNLPNPLETPADQPAPGISFNTKKENQTIRERSREVEKVKVQQEGNPDNFVVIERIKQMTFGNTGKEPRVRAAGDEGTTTPVRRPEDLSSGDPDAIPVLESGDVLFVPKKSLPPGTLPRTGEAQPGDIYFQIKDRVYIFAPPAPGPLETLIP